MYQIETFALMICRAVNKSYYTWIYDIPTIYLVIAKLYTSYGGMQSCRDTIVVTKLIRRITRQRMLYSMWRRPVCLK